MDGNNRIVVSRLPAEEGQPPTFRIHSNGDAPHFNVTAKGLDEVREAVEHYFGLGCYILTQEPSHANAERGARCPICREVRR
jgi:hypothetical protein